MSEVSKNRYKEGDINIYSLAKTREKKMRGLRSMTCVKDEDDKVPLKDVEIKGRQRGYLYKLFNVNHESNLLLEVDNSKTNDRIKYIKNIRVVEIKDTLRMKKVRKGVGLNSIPV